MSLTLYPLGDYIQLLQRKNLQLEFSGAPLTREVSLVSCDSRQVVPGTPVSYTHLTLPTIA